MLSGVRGTQVCVCVCVCVCVLCDVCCVLCVVLCAVCCVLCAVCCALSPIHSFSQRTRPSHATSLVTTVAQQLATTPIARIGLRSHTAAAACTGAGAAALFLAVSGSSHHNLTSLGFFVTSLLPLSSPYSAPSFSKHLISFSFQFSLSPLTYPLSHPLPTLHHHPYCYPLCTQYDRIQNTLYDRMQRALAKERACCVDRHQWQCSAVLAVAVLAVLAVAVAMQRRFGQE